MQRAILSNHDSLYRRWYTCEGQRRQRHFNFVAVILNGHNIVNGTLFGLCEHSLVSRRPIPNIWKSPHRLSAHVDELLLSIPVFHGIFLRFGYFTGTIWVLLRWQAFWPIASYRNFFYVQNLVIITAQFVLPWTQIFVAWIITYKF